jgi:glycosyltransferase involved in cell wall biosynthesis
VTAVPRLGIGLPVGNGENYLSESLDALLGQSYTDFELIISDNASTDGTEDTCRQYLAQDRRIRYVRQPRNIGCAANHNLVVRHARGELFKWASHDDLYGRDLLRRCVEALDEHPDVVLASCWSALIDGAGNISEVVAWYPPATDSTRAPERFRGLLFALAGDDDYGVIRTDVLRRIPPTGSYYHADRTFVAELALHGRFHRIPETLYFRRDRPDRAGRPQQTVRGWCVNHDRRRADRLRHPTVRLLAEYVWAFADAIRRAPLSAADKRQCYRELAGYLASRALPWSSRRTADGPTPTLDTPFISIDAVVAGRERRSR